MISIKGLLTVALLLWSGAAWAGGQHVGPPPFGLATAAVPISAAPLATLAPTSSYANQGQALSGGSYYCSATCLLSAVINFPATASYYNFVVTGCLNAAATGSAYEGLIMVFVDQLAVGWGNATGFAQKMNNYAGGGDACATTANYTFTMPVLSGNHLVTLWMDNNVTVPEIITNFSIASTTGTVTAEPAGTRSSYLQPLSSKSIWNTAIGSGAVWSLVGDADTLSITGVTEPVINSGQWSVPFYEGALTDPVQVFYNQYYAVTTVIPVAAHMPAGMVVAPPIPGGDHQLALMDGTNTRYLLAGNQNCVVLGSTDYGGIYAGVVCAEGIIYDMCNPALDTGWGEQNVIGIIRAGELTAGSIPHMLAFALATQLVAAVPTPWTANGWPMWASDYSGAFGGYTGNVPFGSTIGIPSTVNVTTLGLTASGLAEAHALQDYGAIMTETGGEPNNQLTLFAEEAAEGTSQLTDARNDMATLIPYLRILRNQAPSTPNGGGTPRQPTQAGLAICQGVR